MLAELLQSLSNDVAMGLAQAAGAIVLCLAVVLLCGWFAVHVERETAISLVRGLVQMVLVGVVLALLLHGNLLVGALILLAMTFAAAVTASRRAQGIEGALLLSRVGRYEETKEILTDEGREASALLLTSMLATERGEYTEALTTVKSAEDVIADLREETKRVYLVLADLLGGTAAARSGDLKAAQARLASRASIASPGLDLVQACKRSAASMPERTQEC